MGGRWGLQEICDSDLGCNYHRHDQAAVDYRVRVLLQLFRRQCFDGLFAILDAVQNVLQTC